MLDRILYKAKIVVLVGSKNELNNRGDQHELHEGQVGERAGLQHPYKN